MPGRRLTAVERFFGTGYPRTQVARAKCRLQIATSHTGYSQLLNDEPSVKEPLKLPYFLKAALINLGEVVGYAAAEHMGHVDHLRRGSEQRHGGRHVRLHV